MRISAAFPSTYLKAADLQGRNVTVQIDRVELDEIGGEHKPILYFIGKEKGIVLNKTNANTLAAAYGDDTDNWHGGDVTLFSMMVDFQGKSVESIRVKVPPRMPAKQGSVTTSSGPQSYREQQAPPPSQAMPDDAIPF
jgi:hypothetical protein